MPPAHSRRPSPSNLFGDRAVLQRDKPVPIWGTANPGEPITVRFRGQCETTLADSDGGWEVRLKPMPASADPADLEIAGKGTHVVRDLVVGDVWLASGQSNMEFTVKGVSDAAREMSAADLPLVRHFKVERAVSGLPVREIPTRGWESASPATVGEFTAVGYFFAREVIRRIGVPIGIVHSSWGGTPVESWMSEAARGSTSVAAVLRERWLKAMAKNGRPKGLAAIRPRWPHGNGGGSGQGGDSPIPWNGRSHRPRTTPRSCPEASSTE